jgi:hypothetical protein
LVGEIDRQSFRARIDQHASHLLLEHFRIGETTGLGR